MVYDSSAEADIRGLKIDKAVKGFGITESILKSHVANATTDKREIRWYRKGLTLATAMNAIDTSDTTDITASQIKNVSFGARPFVTEQKWERQQSFVRKYSVESPWITIEDIRDNDVRVMATNLRELVRAVVRQVDARIYDVLTGGTDGTPNPAGASIPTTAATAGWATTATCDPIKDILVGQRKMRDGGYNPTKSVILMNQLEYQSLLVYLISVKGSSFPDFAEEKLRNGVVMSLLGNKVLVNQNATADWVIQWIPDESVTWNTFIGLTSAVLDEPGIGKKIRIWEEGEAYLSDPLSVHVISSAS